MPGIVVGVDGSGHSQRALEWAMDEAAIRHVPLSVLTVHPAIVGYFGGVVTSDTRSSRLSPAGPVGSLTRDFGPLFRTSHRSAVGIDGRRPRAGPPVTSAARGPG